MFPVLFQIGSFQLNTYTALIDVGFAVALVALYRRAPAEKKMLWLDAGLAAIVGGFIGARLVYALVNGNYYALHPEEAFMVWRGGLAWPGAVVGGLLGTSLYCSLKREPLRPLLDALALPIALLGLLSWGGCLAGSCAYGYDVQPGQLPAWMTLTAPDIYGIVAPRWPTQAAGALWSLFVMLVVWNTARTMRWPAGANAAYAISLTALGAFLLAFTRGDPMPLINAIRLDLLGSGLILLIATAVWMTLITRKSSITQLPDHSITQ
jgi:prolipoprotein diacylglyceryltransferase